MGKFEGIEIYRKLSDFAKKDTGQKIMTFVFILAGVIYQIWLGTERLYFVLIAGVVLILVALFSSVKDIIIKDRILDHIDRSRQSKAILQKMSFNNSVAQSVILQIYNYLTSSESPDPLAVQHYANILKDISAESPEIADLIEKDFDVLIRSWSDKDDVLEDISSYSRHKIENTIKGETKPNNTIKKQVNEETDKIDDFNKPTNDVNSNS